MNVKAVSFYTAGDYALHAQELVRSAAQWRMTIETREQGPFARWQDAVCHKPSFIAAMLDELPTTFDGVVWTDADSRFRARPDWSLLADADFAACRFRWSNGHPLEMLTGTLWFRKNDIVREFLRGWIEATAQWKPQDQDTPEQKALMQVFGQAGHQLRFVELPPTWVWIEPEFRNIFNGQEPVISHLQASRTLRA